MTLSKLLAVALGCAGAMAPLGARAQALPNPILFTTQVPMPHDFATIGSVFANHEAGIRQVPRGGDLWIRYANGDLRNLTAAAGLGVATGFQGAASIAVRDPAVHWSGTKAIFSMVTGAPATRYATSSFYFQLYEITSFGAGQTPVIAKVANQPANYNNVQATYASDGTIIFVSDRPRGGERHLYPQHDEYESTATPTGLWKLDPASGSLVLLQHSPSGSFTPIVDSYGRVVFTRWDHLQRDQQNEGGTNPYGTFNYTSEAANATATTDRSEVFPEPRIAVQGVPIAGHTLNQFFPWMVNQDGTEEETLNHVGRHELHGYFAQSFLGDANLDEFIADSSARANRRNVLNLLQLREDPNLPGRYIAIDAPEFGTHAAGQIVRFAAPPNLNAQDIVIEYLTPRSTFGTTAAPDHSGHYRNPIVLTNGAIIASHTSATGYNGNTGTRANPATDYQFRLRRMTSAGGGYLTAGTLLTSGITKNVTWWDPDELITWNGPLWELGAVEVVARATPPIPGAALKAPEIAAFNAEGVDPGAFRTFLREKDLAVFVMRDVTTRDANDRQQPFNLRVAGGHQTLGAGGTVYDVAHLQMFQGDQIRGRGGNTSPAPGRRVLAKVMHDADAVANNGANPGGPAGSVPIFADGSVAIYVPTQRALTWQTTSANGTPVVRERYWISAQPGEIRACDGCHGINEANQAGGVAATNVSLAFRDMLQRWKVEGGAMFSNSFEQ